jgi:hypothetical protein
MDKNVTTLPMTSSSISSSSSISLAPPSESIIQQQSLSSSILSPSLLTRQQTESSMQFDTTITTAQLSHIATSTTTTRIIIHNKKTKNKKKYHSKLKYLFLLNAVGIILVGLLFVLIIGVLNLQNCNLTEHEHNVPLYLIVFSVLCIARILIYFSCPFNYSLCRRKKKLDLETSNDTQETSCCCCCLFSNRKSDSFYASTSFQASSSFLSYLSFKLSNNSNGTSSNNKKSTSIIWKPYKIIDIRSARYCLSYLTQRILDILIVCWFLYGNFLVFQVKYQSESELQIQQPQRQVNNTAIQNSTITISNLTKKLDTSSKEEFLNCNFCFNVAFFKIIFIYSIFASGFLTIVCYSSGKVFYNLFKNESPTESSPNR